MKEKSLFKLLVLPLAIATAAAMSFCFLVEEPWRGLLVNLAATFLGTIVTVFYVDRILRRNEERRWQGVKGYVGKQVTIIANATASSVRTALGIPLPDTWITINASSDPAEMRQMMIQLIELDLLPAVSGLGQIDQSDWRTFARNLLGTISNCELLISLFGTKLDAEIMALILDLQEKTREVLTPYQILPDMLGVPFDQLKPNRRGESSVPIVRAMLDGAIRDTGQLLRICAMLLRETGGRFPERNAGLNDDAGTAKRP